MGQLGLEDNPRGAFVVHFSIAVVILITLAVVLRLAARYRSKAAFAVDDLWIVGSLLPFYGMIAASTTRMPPIIMSAEHRLTIVS